MNFDLSEEQQMFKASAQRFAAPIDVEARQQIRNMDGGYDKSRWKQLAELGFLALAADEAQGGMNGSNLDLAVIAEAFGTGNSMDPWLENGVLPARLLTTAKVGNSSEPYLSGERIAAFAFAEPSGRYRITPKITKARKDGDGYILNGEKNFVLGGAIADDVIVTADLGGQMAFFFIPLTHKNIERRPYRVADGSIACELFLRNAKVAETARLEITDDQFENIISDVNLLAAAEMVGLGQCLLNDTLDYVKQREQFGVSIGSFQAIQHGLTDAYAALEQMRSMMLRGLLMKADGNTTAMVAGAKAFITQQAQFIAGRAVQYHGGMGITDELAIGHAVKRLMLLGRLFGGAADNLGNYARAA